MKPIESAWNGYRKACIPEDASSVQVSECRLAFMAGACILHTTIMHALSPGSRVTKPDVNFMIDLQAEITAFGQELDRAKLGKLGGNPT